MSEVQNYTTINFSKDQQKIINRDLLFFDDNKVYMDRLTQHYALKYIYRLIDYFEQFDENTENDKDLCKEKLDRHHYSNDIYCIRAVLYHLNKNDGVMDKYNENVNPFTLFNYYEYITKNENGGFDFSINKSYEDIFREPDNYKKLKMVQKNILNILYFIKLFLVVKETTKLIPIELVFLEIDALKLKNIRNVFVK